MVPDWGFMDTAQVVKECDMRHENGNCLPAGGFCTANRNICEALQNAYDAAYRAGYRRAIEEFTGRAKIDETKEPELRIGDEVEFGDIAYGPLQKGIIIQTSDTCSTVYTTNGAIQRHNNAVYTKTSRTFPEMEMILKEVGYRA